MQVNTITLSSNSAATLTSYLQDTDPTGKIKNRPLLIFVPGGSYTHIPTEQSETVALRFIAAGFQVAVLRYSFIDEKEPLFPNPIIELAQSVIYAKNHSNDWNIDPSKIILMGFSVGGHIVSNYNNYWSSEWLSQKVDSNQDQLKIAATILGYPVISPFLGFPDSSTLVKWTDDPERYAADQNVTTSNVPSFIWTTQDDQLVPSKNSLKYYQALVNAGVTTEIHIFSHGPHGMALANKLTAKNDAMTNSRIAKWPTLALNWLDEIL